MSTTVSLDDAVKQRLEIHRHPHHEDWNDVIETIVDILPMYDELHENGCAHCGEPPWSDVPLDRVGGFLNWFEIPEDHGGGIHSEWFCSRDCLDAGLDERDKYAPEEPDLVVVGGYQQPRAELTDAAFGMDGSDMWVGIDVPGAFSGEKRYSGEFSYEGEPVYVKNRGEWVHTGVIDTTFHEEGHTSLELASFADSVPVRLCHPDEEIRERRKEDYMPWLSGHCGSCDVGYRFQARDPPEECSECGSSEIENEELDEDDLVDVEIEALEGRVPGIGDVESGGEEA